MPETLTATSSEQKNTTLKWLVRPPAPVSEIEALVKRFSIPPLLANVLLSRGLDEETNLEPALELTQIPDLDKAASRLENAIYHKRRIFIHGDYDADGISGTATLTLGLRALGGDVTPFIPNRLQDGYGIHPERVKDHADKADLFITVDCGISNLAEIEYLQKAGVEVIVSDHHQPGDVLPNCLIVHPKMSPSAQQGLPELTGAGIAYHLLWALHERLGLAPPVQYSDIATIGTIADVAPLLGENRALIQQGLTQMANSDWPGLRAAISQSRIKGTPSARDVAFILAPRLNAAGRLGEADLGLELLMTASERRAKELAVYLDARNNERRGIQDKMFEHALSKVDPQAPALILDDTDWHPGVMGIVASKLLEKFYKPVFIIAGGKGSVRSPPGLSAVKALRYASNTLKRFGGHSQAAGFAIQEDKVADFKASILEYTREHPVPEPVVLADALISADEVSDDLYKAISSLEPYGQGHPSPLFALTDTLDMARAVGKTKTTLQLRVAGLKGVAWQKGDMAPDLRAGSTVNAVISLRENIWKEKRSLEFVAENVRQGDPLGFEDTEAPLAIFRGSSKDAFEFTTIQNLADLDVQAVLLKTLPLGDDPLTATQPLTPLLKHKLYFDLSAKALYELAQTIQQYPSLHDIRRSFVCLQRGQTLPFGPEKTKLIFQILEDLELLNDQNKPYRGQKRDPYSSETLVKGLMERYKLQSFLNAYKYFDDEAFAITVATLF